MDRVNRLREDLAFVDRMIAECRHHIARLQTTAAETSGDGENPGLADDLLGCFTAALTRYEAERNRLASAGGGDNKRSAREAPLSVSAS